MRNIVNPEGTIIPAKMAYKGALKTTAKTIALYSAAYCVYYVAVGFFGELKRIREKNSQK